MTNNTIPSVPRQLLERASNLAFQTQHYPLHEDLRAILSTPSPAGVDGCKCSMSISVLGDGCRYCQPQEHIDQLGEMLDEERAELSAAQAIIDGLRGKVAELESTLADNLELSGKRAVRIAEIGHELADAISERDRHAWRIGELEGLLLRVQVSLSLDDTEWGYSGAEKYKLLAGIRTALSAGKDAAP